MYLRRRRQGLEQTWRCCCISDSHLAYRLKIPPAKNRVLNYSCEKCVWFGIIEPTFTQNLLHVVMCMSVFTDVIRLLSLRIFTILFVSILCYKSNSFWNDRPYETVTRPAATTHHPAAESLHYRHSRSSCHFTGQYITCATDKVSSDNLWTSPGHDKKIRGRNIHITCSITSA